MNMEKYAIPYIGRRRARDLRPGDFDRLYQKLREDAGSGRGLADSSLKKVHSWLRSAFAYAVRRGLLSQNPVEGATPGRVTHREIGYFTAEQVSLLLDKWEQSEAGKSLHYNREGLGPVWLFLFETGVRPEELIGLTWEAVTPSAMLTAVGRVPPSVTIRRVVVRSHRLRGWRFDTTKTLKSRRTIPISPTLAAALADHRATVASLRSKAGARWREHDLVFPARYGEPLWEYRLRYCFKGLIESVGLDPRRYGLYCTRHTMATLLLARNVNPKVVSERLGHSSIRITLDTYSHVIPSLQVDATGVIHEAIFGGGDKDEAAA
jgi:integrase